jgi:hypothetical protein
VIYLLAGLGDTTSGLGHVVLDMYEDRSSVTESLTFSCFCFSSIDAVAFSHSSSSSRFLETPLLICLNLR